MTSGALSVLCPQRGSEELMTSAAASSTNGAVTLSDNNNDAKKVSRDRLAQGGDLFHEFWN